jgi:tRNA(Ile)-lysidine synthase
LNIAMRLQERVLRALRRHALSGAGSRVLVALSGGADSVALLHLIRDLDASGDLTLAGAAHLNHLLRGADADADEAFCAALAARLEIPFLAARVDVAELAREERRSVEDAARRARYAFLEDAADRVSADAIAVAHTRDDQAETFLLRILRGSGTRGLGGIRPRVGRVIRPLLNVDRTELRQFLAERAEPHREDLSNDEVTILRNRVRHELLPLLESRFSPGITDVLAREATLAQQDEDFLRRQAIESARRIVLTNEENGDEGLRIDARALRSTPRALGSRVAHDVLCRLAGARSVSFDHVERLLALAEEEEEDGDRALCLPGQHAVRHGDVILLRPGRPARRVEANSFSFLLSIPGEVQSLPHGWAIAAELSSIGAPADKRLSARGREVAIAAGAVALPLGIRNRRPGDRFHPLGAPGGRKLQDFMVDRKVPRTERDTLPLVVDALDRIVWVVGQSVGEGFRVLDPSQGVIFLKVKRLGGPG